MKNRLEIIFCGVGGQGLLLNGTVLGAAVSIIEKRQAVMTSAYGLETRGTFTKADLILSDEYIDFPECLEPDVVVSLAPVAYERYVDKMGENSVIIYDACHIREKPSKARQYGINIDDLAVQAGDPQSLNIVALGAMIALTGCAKPESALEILRKRFSGNERVIAVNEKAFNLGYQAGARRAP